MVRELTNHRANDVNEGLRIEVMDEPGHGGANHVYRISFSGSGGLVTSFRFQKGGIAEAGINGVTQESLLAIVEDRLASFQAGPYACRENEIALRHVRIAMDSLKDRTRERVARGVEGTSTP